jgi:hypothetical protein
MLLACGIPFLLFYLWTLALGFNLLVFPSGWFMIALEDYPQASWALQVLERNWIQAHEWRVRFLSRPLRFVEPRYLCLVFGEASYPLYITLHCKRKDTLRRSASRYAIEFNDNGTVEAKVRSRLLHRLDRALILLRRTNFARSAFA